MNVLLTLFLLFLVIVLLFTNLKYRDNFQTKDIICDTIQDKKECINYGCKYLNKETDLKCADGTDYTKNNGCPIFIKSKLEKQLNEIESKNKGSEVSDDIYYKGNLVYIVKPGEYVNNYLDHYLTKIANRPEYTIDAQALKNKKTILNQNKIIFNPDIARVCGLNPERCWNNYNSIKNQMFTPQYIAEKIETDSKIEPFMHPNLGIAEATNILFGDFVKILYINKSYPNIDLVNEYDEYVYIDEVRVVDLRKYNPITRRKEMIYKAPQEVIKNCELMGGTEIQLTDNSRYKICSDNLSSRCISNYDEGCFHINNEDICKNKTNCNWNDTNKYCYPNLTLEKDHTCLNKNKNKNTCSSDPDCRYYDHINKCLNIDHDLCNTYTEDNCNKDDLCHWNEHEQSCNVKKSLSNLANNINTTIPSNHISNIDFNSNSLNPSKASIYKHYIIDSTSFM